MTAIISFRTPQLLLENHVGMQLGLISEIVKVSYDFFRQSLALN